MGNMQVDEKLIVYLEDLSNLTLSDAEKIRLIEDLKKILGCFSGLCETNTDGVPASSHPWDSSIFQDITNVLRDDKVFPSVARELILKNASVKNDEFFIAPKTVTE